ncbi:MAG TPA: TolC family protein [Anaeromyxobacter sp.]
MKTLTLAVALTLPGPAALAQAARAAPPAPRPVLGLGEAVRTALEHQPQIRQAQANRDVASARAESARAPLLPQLRGEAFYDWNTSNSGPKAGPAGTITPATGTSFARSESVGASATLSQVLFDAAQFQRYRSALAAESALEASQRAAALQIAAAARAAFFAARAARDLVAVARETLANEEAHLRQAQAFVEVGTRPEIDLAQARAARANAAVQLIQAENGYDTARAQLAQAMGVERATDFEVGDDVLPPIPREEEPLDALFAEALSARPELASFREQERAQALARSAARAGYLPTVGAQTGILTQGPTWPAAVPNWNTGVTLTWNLFQGGATRAAVHESEATLDLLTAQEEQFRQQVRLDVEQARLAVRAARATLGAAGEAVAAAKDRLRLAEGRYQAGAGSIIELGDAQVAAASAAAQAVRSDYDLSASRALLLRALGRLNP